MKTGIFNLKGSQVGEIDLPDTIFKKPWNADLVHQVLVALETNRRKPLAHTKDRSEVRGGGKKPWRQKGTGRARHGSIRSPIWRGGGVTHGPNNERSYEKKINKKMKRAAIYSALSKKLALGELRIIDDLKIDNPKTKHLDSALKIFFNKPKNNKKLSVLLVPAKNNKIIFRLSANIPKVKSLNPHALNLEDLFKYKDILIDKEAVREIK